jgi:hypothetical protein
MRVGSVRPEKWSGANTPNHAFWNESMSQSNATAVKADDVSTENDQTTLTTYAQFATERADTATDGEIVIGGGTDTETDEDDCQKCTDDLRCFEHFELEGDQ